MFWLGQNVSTLGLSLRLSLTTCSVASRSLLVSCRILSAVSSLIVRMGRAHEHLRAGWPSSHASRSHRIAGADVLSCGSSLVSWRHTAAQAKMARILVGLSRRAHDLVIRRELHVIAVSLNVGAGQARAASSCR